MEAVCSSKMWVPHLQIYKYLNSEDNMVNKTGCLCILILTDEKREEN
jgi:hypothetical protein